MTTFNKFLRYTDRQLCTQLLDDLAIDYPSHWHNSHVSARTINKELSQLAPQELQRLQAIAERLYTLCNNELGQTLLRTHIRHQAEFDVLDNPYDQGAWALHYEPLAFEQAEHAFFHDSRRHSRLWDGFLLKPLNTFNEQALHNKFLKGLQDYFGNRQALYIESFERQQEDATVKQIMIYREGLPMLINEVNKSRLTEKIIKPAREIALTWNPNNGAIEIVSHTGVNRSDIVKHFATSVLGYSGTADTVPLKQYCLDGLRQRPAFEVEPHHGIESVTVTQIILSDMSGIGEFAITVAGKNKQSVDVYDLIHQRHLQHLLQSADLHIKSASFTVVYYEFFPDRQNNKRQLTFKITGKNRCNLKDQTALEQLINDELLSCWGLLAS